MFFIICLFSDSSTAFIKQNGALKVLAFGFFFVTFFRVLCSHEHYMHFPLFFSLSQESFDSSKPITAADVHQVFDNLAKKRRRVE